MHLRKNIMPCSGAKDVAALVILLNLFQGNCYRRALLAAMHGQIDKHGVLFSCVASVLIPIR